MVFQSMISIQITVSLICILLYSTCIASITRVNGTPYSVDGSQNNTSVTFITTDFPNGAVVTNVLPSITFAKISNDNCYDPDFTGVTYYDEISWVLSYGGVSVVLVGSGQYSQGTPDSSTVFTLTFNSASTTPAAGDPANGVFQPNQDLSAFNGLSPVGTWTLIAADNTVFQPLCMYEWRLTINCATSQSYGFSVLPSGEQVEIIDNSLFDASLPPLTPANTQLLGVISKVVVSVTYAKFSGSQCNGTGDPLLQQFGLALSFSPSAVGGTPTTVTLVQQGSWTASGAPSGFFTTIFDSDASAAYPSSWLNGTVQPYQSLASLQDYQAAGTWSLLVSDGALGASVCFTGWRLTIDSCLGACGTYSYTAQTTEGQPYSISWQRGALSGNQPVAQQVQWGEAGYSSSSITSSAAVTETFNYVYGAAGLPLLRYTSTVAGVCRGAAVFSVQVNNIAPVITTGFPSQQYNLFEGNSLQLPDVIFHDAGSLDTHTASMDWGDGSAVQQQSVTDNLIGPPGAPGGSSGTVSLLPHVYRQDGTFIATLTITDSGGAKATQSLTAIIGSRIFIDAIGTINAEVGLVTTLNVGWQDSTSIAHNATVNWGDASAPLPAAVDPATAATSGRIVSQHIFTAAGNYSALVQLEDPDAISANEPFTVLVYEPRPQLTLKRFGSGVHVAQTVSLPNCSFTGSPLRQYSATINWGDGTISNATVYQFSFGGGVVVGSHAYTTAFYYDVQVQVRTVDGQFTASAATNVIVQNSAPLLSSVPPINVFVYETLDLIVSFSDAGTQKAYSAQIDWGLPLPDNSANYVTSAIVTDPSNGQLGSIQSSFSYPQPSPFTVDQYSENIYAPYNGTVTLSDNLGGLAIIGFQVTVRPGALYVEAGPSLFVVQGIPFNLTVGYVATGVPPRISAVFDWSDGVDSFDVQHGASLTDQHIYYTAGSVNLVSVSISDDYDAPSTDTTLVFVSNFAPNVTIRNSRQLSSVIVEQGTEYVVDVLYFDAGIFDSHVAVINWGDGSPLVYINDLQPTEDGFGSFERSYVFNDVGTFEAIVAVIDSSNAQGLSTLKVQVINVAPVVTTVAPFAITTRKFQGTLATIFDQGPNDTHTAVIDWGDGSSSPGAVSGPSVLGVHNYTRKGTFFVIVSVQDNHGGSGSGILSITIN